MKFILYLKEIQAQKSNEIIDKRAATSLLFSPVISTSKKRLVPTQFHRETLNQSPAKKKPQKNELIPTISMAFDHAAKFIKA